MAESTADAFAEIKRLRAALDEATDFFDEIYEVTREKQNVLELSSLKDACRKASTMASGASSRARYALDHHPQSHRSVT